MGQLAAEKEQIAERPHDLEWWRSACEASDGIVRGCTKALGFRIDEIMFKLDEDITTMLVKRIEELKEKADGGHADN